MRAIAVMLVIKHHWGPFKLDSVIADFIMSKLLPSGAFAVDVFFVLSGFLITGILLKAVNEANGVPFKTILKNFVVRRALRIFPIYYCCLLVLFIFNYPGVRHDILILSTYTTNFLIFKQLAWNTMGYTWTLAVEEQFYLLWPLVILFVPRKYLWHIIIFFIAGSSIISAIMENRFGFFATTLPFNCFNAFAIGGALAYSMQNGKHETLVKRVFVLLLPVAIAAYVLTLSGINTLFFRLTYSIIAVNIIIYVLKPQHNRLTRFILNNRLTTGMGKISYGMYLYHALIPFFYYRILHVLEGRLHLSTHFIGLLYYPYLAEVLEFILLILLSIASYKLIEMPFLRLKRHFEYSRASIPEAV